LWCLPFFGRSYRGCAEAQAERKPPTLDFGAQAMLSGGAAKEARVVDDAAWLFWLAAVGGALLLGFGAGYIERRGLRYAALVLLSLAPVLAIFVHGLGNGCAPGVSGEDCLGYGFGIALFLMAAPVFLVFLLVGMWANRLVRRR
jgi:hypothetical protein